MVLLIANSTITGAFLKCRPETAFNVVDLRNVPVLKGATFLENVKGKKKEMCAENDGKFI